MTEDKPIAKPIIDDATREKMALMFSGEVYLPDDVDGFFDLQAAQRDLQLELNATPLTNPKRRTELMQAFFGAAGEGLYLECPVYANWGCNTYGSVKPTLTYERGALIREEVQTFSLWPLLLNGYRYSKARGVHVQHQCSGCGS